MFLEVQKKSEVGGLEDLRNIFEDQEVGHHLYSVFVRTAVRTIQEIQRQSEEPADLADLHHIFDIVRNKHHRERTDQTS